MLYILISDIKGHTRWIRENNIDTKRLQAMLKDFYSLTRKGCLHKNFNSDEILFIYEQADDAVKAAKELQTSSKKLTEKYGLDIAIALHAGELEEFSYSIENKVYKTYLGLAINYCRRLEEISYGGDITASDRIYKDISPALQSDFKIHKEVTLRSFEKPVKIHIDPV